MSEDPRASGANGKNHIRLRLSILIVLVFLGGFLFYKTGLIHFFMDKDRIMAFLDSLGPLAFLGFSVLQASQVVISPIPGDVTGFIGGYVFGPYLGVILSTIGLVVGSYVAFALARAFGRPLVDRFVDKAVMDRFDYVLHSKGIFLIFLLFLIPGFPKDYLCYICGLGHLTTLEFLAVSTIGRLFGTILLTLGGDYIRCHQYVRFNILVVVSVIVIIVALTYRKKMECLFKSWHVKGCRTTPKEQK